MNIAVLGYGTVGKALVDIIDKKIDFINVVKILRSEKSIIETARETKNFDEILEDENIDTVVECIGGIYPSFDYVSECIKNNKNVVTSNKQMLATKYDDIINLSNKFNISFLFEATVGGALPWIENLSNIAFVEKIKSFQGIFNGTTNYILDTMTNCDIDFNDALCEAKKLGYAEKDPTNDIDGFDILYKLVISANVATNKSYDMSNIIKFGIRNISKKDIDYFKMQNKIIKLIGEYDNENNLIFVLPVAYDKNKQIAMTKKNYNFIKLNCDTSLLSFIGPGAGGIETAHSIIQDLIKIYRKFSFKYNISNNIKINYNNYKSDFYIRYVDDTVDIKKNHEILNLGNNPYIKFLVKI